MAIAITKIIEPHIQDLGGFDARRLLPNDFVPMVGPFIFFDHVGRAIFPPGEGIDVRPHPHINLATVTYLFEGTILHRDSLGTVQEIRPGAVNWMTAGKGISHSERSPESERVNESALHGIQTWIALPEQAEEVAPSFSHYPAGEIPTWEEDGVNITLITGKYGDHESPVTTFSPIFYLDLVFAGEDGGEFQLNTQYSERAVYSVTEGISVNGEAIDPFRLVILSPGEIAIIRGTNNSRAMVIGGEPIGLRYKWWNFISSRRDRIEQAKQDWLDQKFGQVPNETEFIPLPEN
jgi:redox-sensitive bicupin YhaK (pirin superfamily)